MQLSPFELAVLLTYVDFIYTSEGTNPNYSQIFNKSGIIPNFVDRLTWCDKVRAFYWINYILFASFTRLIYVLKIYLLTSHYPTCSPSYSPPYMLTTLFTTLHITLLTTLLTTLHAHHPTHHPTYHSTHHSTHHPTRFKTCFKIASKHASRDTFE